MKKERFDIVHHVLPFSPITGNPLALENKITSPFVIGPAMLPQKEMNYEEFCSWLGIKKGITANALYFAFKKVTLRKSKEFENTIKRVDRLICVNNEAAEFYSKYIEKEKIRVIPAGIDTNKFSPPEKSKDDKEHRKRIRIIAVGNLISRKGFMYLIDAIKLLNNLDFEVVIIGKGPEEEMLKERAHGLGNELENKVIFKGHVPFSLIQEEYRSSDIFCNPTLSEPFGQVNLEAMACGLPVVGSNVGGLKEIITEDTGIKVEPGDVYGLSEALRKLITDDKLRQKLGVSARKRAVENYSWDAICSKYVEVYKEFYR
jgi:glycosyltransferase involved in cell wall biosynthesis